MYITFQSIFVYHAFIETIYHYTKSNKTASGLMNIYVCNDDYPEMLFAIYSTAKGFQIPFLIFTI